MPRVKTLIEYPHEGKLDRVPGDWDISKHKMLREADFATNEVYHEYLFFVLDERERLIKARFGEMMDRVRAKRENLRRLASMSPAERQIRSALSKAERIELAKLSPELRQMLREEFASLAAKFAEL